MHVMDREPESIGYYYEPGQGGEQIPRGVKIEREGSFLIACTVNYEPCAARA